MHKLQRQPGGGIQVTTASARRVAGWLATLALLTAAAYYGASHHPVTKPPSESTAEAEIAAVFSQPADSDSDLQGDLLIERFYILDVDSGQVKVADICKGKILHVIATPGGDWVGYRYTLVLDRAHLSGDSERLSAFVRQTVPPDAREDSAYLGLRVQVDSYELFSLNYDGSLPAEDVVFEDQSGRDAYTFLREQAFVDISRRGLELVGVKGNNFVLGNTELVPGWGAQFGVKRAIVLGELIMVDATSPDQERLYSERPSQAQ
jgi:hypothetical protein